MISVEQLFGLGEQDPVDTAAAELAEALRKNPSRKPLSVWKKTVAKVLGVQRLHQKRYEEVIERGVQQGLFVIREDGPKPYLEIGTAIAEADAEESVEVVDSATEEVAESVAESVADSTLPAADPKPEVPPPPPKPEKFDPPTYMDCGHMNWGTPEEHTQAREEGFCCGGGKAKRPVNYRYLKGKYAKPVPKSLRRSKERVQGMGYPGLCCDEEGYFIGGIFNDCQREGKLCTYHKQEKEEAALQRSSREKKSKE